MPSAQTKPDPTELALNALAWTLGEPQRAARLLDVTGLTPTDLRTRAATPPVLAAVLQFLEGHEPDLVACAADLHVRPEAIVAARAVLEERS